MNVEGSVKLCGPQDRVEDENLSMNDDDSLISQAYDQFLIGSNANTNQTCSILKDVDIPMQDENFVSGCIQEERYELANEDYTVDGENASYKYSSRKTPIIFLEELITVEDLIGPICSTITEKFNEPDIDMFQTDNDLSDASVIATLTLLKIFDHCWIIIANKPQLKNSVIAATTAVNEIFERVWKIIQPKNRWRIPNPATWKRNVAKKRRCDGLSYVTSNKCRPAKVPRTVDCSNCKFKCSVNFSETDRERSCRKYWAQSYTAKKNMILSLIEVKPIKTTLLDRKRNTKRSNSKQYFFFKDGVKSQVCQKFFCKTLCISASGITEAVERRDAMGFYSRDLDPRGRHEPQNKTPPEQAEEIRRHIKSFPTMESHYVRKDINRQYLDSSLSITKMYRLYVEECEKKSITPTYRNIFCTEFNLGFFVPKKDQCLLCTKYRRLDTEEKAKLEEEYRQHIQRKDACNSEKQRDKERAEKEKNFISASFDMQAILQIPSGDIGLLYYCRKLTLYNLTIYESALPNEAFCYAWTEINGKKGSSEIGSIILYYLNQIPYQIDEVSLFSDTCGGQNRNQYVAAVLLWAVHKIDHLKLIEHKFLESGHSYMEVDSMHISIESALKHSNIYSTTEWLNIFRRARSSRQFKGKNKGQTKKPYHVKEMKYTDFKDLKMLAKSLIICKGKTSNNQRVEWLKIKRMRYVKGETKIYFNYDMSENFFFIDLGIKQLSLDPPSKTQDQSHSKDCHRYGTRLQSKQVKPVKKVVTEPPPQSTNDPCFPEMLNPLYKEPLCISTAKKTDLLKLCEKGVIPDEYHGWFQNLRDDSKKVDRVPDLTVSEESEDSD